MPELPEVETIVGALRSAGIIGRKVLTVIVRWPPLVQGRSVTAFKKLVQGSTICGISRRGKFIVIALSNGYFLLVHLRMSGHLSLANADQPREAHQHLVLRLSNNRELRYRDTRKFGRWQITRDPFAILGALGPEPLAKSFKKNDFYRRLKVHRRQLKPLLLDQRVIAGVGNIYANEALWEARLHPRRLASSLDARESLRLFNAVRRVLRRGIRNRGTSLGKGQGNYLGGRNQDRLRVFHKSGLPCPRCGVIINRLLVGQRATYFCAKCQKE